MTDASVIEVNATNTEAHWHICSPENFGLSATMVELLSMDNIVGPIGLGTASDVLRDDPLAKAFIIYPAVETFADYTNHNTLKSSLSRWRNEMQAVLLIVRQFRKRVVLAMEQDLPKLLHKMKLIDQEYIFDDLLIRKNDPLLAEMVRGMLSHSGQGAPLLGEVEASSTRVLPEAHVTSDELAGIILTYRNVLSRTTDSIGHQNILRGRIKSLDEEVATLHQQITDLKGAAQNGRRHQQQANELQGQVERTVRSHYALKQQHARDAETWHCELAALQDQLSESGRKFRNAQSELAHILNSKSFRLTAGLRRVRSLLSGSRRRND